MSSKKRKQDDDDEFVIDEESQAASGEGAGPRKKYRAEKKKTDRRGRAQRYVDIQHAILASSRFRSGRTPSKIGKQLTSHDVQALGRSHERLSKSQSHHSRQRKALAQKHCRSIR